MKVVLLKDIKGTGKAHSVTDVKGGHALNFLIPRGHAVLATPATIKTAEHMTAKVQVEREVASKLISERIEALANEKIVFVKKANEQGHLYDGVDAKEIAEMAKLPVDAIHIKKAFKDLGTFDVPVAFGEQFGKISITIEAE